ncbi:MAG: DNA repair protein RadA [Bacteriovoracaceae bacterium]|jgi:DNA repair protein RadA/Sms|nr:DNA repair protein RadA [Bacteriovoracaceae bacterium]
MAKKEKSLFLCNGCGRKEIKWMGKCPECNEWNTFSEQTSNDSAVEKRRSHSSDLSHRPISVAEISEENLKRIQTKISEFDRVVGGGLAIGSLTLIGGEPGIGKSTLLLNIAGKVASSLKNGKILYVSGEESEGQIAARAKRLGVTEENIFIINETSWQSILSVVKSMKPSLLIIDSIQTTLSDDIQGAPGTISQVREVTYEIMNWSKALGVTTFIIGHITKEGAIAGPKALEHMVDTVIYFEGDQFGQYRMLRVIKNRFGNANEVGIFEMKENGLAEVSNPSQYFLDFSNNESYGRSLTCIVEGTRSLFVEVQALVVENKYGNGRRTTQGIDGNRLAMLVAVIEKYLGIPLQFNDIYLNVVGGVKMPARASDLSIIASIMSSLRAVPLDEDTIFLGEVGLTGEVRPVPRMEMRLKEMAMMNYKKVITGEKMADEFKDKFPMEIVGIKSANELENILF